MKTLSIRNVLAVVIVGALLGTAYFTNSGLLKAPRAEASPADNVSGWAYSMGNGASLNDGKPGIGWISFNGTDCDADQNGFTDSGVCGGDNATKVAKDYGVRISSLTGTGAFSGYAYSEYGDWISFNQTDLAICPPGAAVAQVNWTTGGNVTGWARALNGSATSGWDGCIKFSDDTNSFWNGKGVKITGGNFSGYAWGGDVMGWIDLAPAIAGTNIVHLPVTPPPNFNFYSTPASVANNGTVVISWNGVTDATSCSPSGGSTGWSSAPTPIGGGSWTTGTLVTSGTPYIYSLTCNGPGGSVPRSTTVTVTAPTPAQTKTHFWQF